MKKYILFLFCFFSLVPNAQEISAHYNQILITNVGYTCVETTAPDPCAGDQIYATIKITQENILISEKTVSSCGEENLIEIGRYSWKQVGNKIMIEYPEERYMYAKIISLELKPNEIVGKIEYPNGNISKKTFEEDKKPLIVTKA